ncbi:MAG: M81 family metallopeptidase [Acidobacteria bacterium]|nr:M81 family metallopeptidase [Acidobacteriota bacterium]
MKHRVALGNIFTESNHLAGSNTTLADFERTELRRGTEVLEVRDGVVGGALRVLAQRGIEVVPLLVASAFPGGILTEDCYLALKNDLLDRLRSALPLDGVLAPLHGAAGVERIGDLEGDLLKAIREIVGPDIPVVVTLDCHAHVTRAMVENCDAMLAWETYPHRDTFTTGERGARLLADILDGKVRPAMAMAKAPLLVSGFKGATDPPGPFAEIMAFAKSLEQRPGVLSTSAFLVHPHLDLPDMGGGGLVITDGDPDSAASMAAELASMLWDRRTELETTGLTPADAVERGLRLDGGPVLLLELSDCVGGGAAGDSIAALRALLHADLSGTSLAMVVDPEAAAACHRAGKGTAVTLTLGHKVDPRWGKPIELSGVVESLADGRFTYTGGIWEGQYGEMGPSAILRVGAVRILVSTHPTYDWADEQYLSLGMDTGAAKFIVVKNPMNYRIGYGGRFVEAFVLDTPGPTTAIIENIDYQAVKRPYFPKDRDVPGFEPAIYKHATRKP